MSECNGTMYDNMPKGSLKENVPPLGASQGAKGKYNQGNKGWIFWNCLVYNVWWAGLYVGSMMNCPMFQWIQLLKMEGINLVWEINWHWHCQKSLLLHQHPCWILVLKSNKCNSSNGILQFWTCSQNVCLGQCLEIQTWTVLLNSPSWENTKELLAYATTRRKSTM